MPADSSTTNQLAQASASDLQQPRSDLQPTSNAPQHGGEAGEATGSISQEQLNNKNLRVGDSNTTVQNTTSTPPPFSEAYSAISWLWIVVVAVVVLLPLLVLRRPKNDAVAGQYETAGREASAKTAPKPVKKKAKPAAKPHRPAKRRTRK